MKYLDEKTEFLSLCLFLDTVPEKISESLKEYEEDFLRFKEIIKYVNSSSDDIYLDAFSDLREALLCR